MLTVTEKQYASMKILVGAAISGKKVNARSNVCCSDGPFCAKPAPAKAGRGFAVGQSGFIRGESGSYNVAGRTDCTHASVAIRGES